MKKNYNLITLNFADAKPPEIKQEKNKDWVTFGTEAGYKNNYPQFLYDLTKKSTKHVTLIDGIARYIVGKGWKIDNDANITNEARAALKNFIASPNPDQTLKQLYKLWVWDALVYGGYYIEGIWSEDGESIAELNHIDFRYVRTNEEKDLFFYTEDWTARKPQENEDFEELELLDLEKRTGKFIIPVNCSNYKDIYPLPEYLPTINHILADHELAKYDLSSIVNQFNGTTFISFVNGQPDDTVQAEIERQIEKKLAGSENASSFIVEFVDRPEDRAIVETITPANVADLYNSLEERVDKAILVAHKVVDPILFGWSRDGSGLSNDANQLRTAHETFNLREAEPKQEEFEEIVNNIVAINGLPQVLEVKPLPTLKDQLSLTELLPYMTQDEIREEHGLEPLGNTTSMSETKFSAETEEFLNDYFSSCGVSQDDYTVLMTVDFQATDINEFRKMDDDKFAAIQGLNDKDLAVLNALNQNPAATNSELAEATKLSAEEVAESVSKLESLGAIEEVDGQRTPTDDGNDTIEEEGQLQLMYRYVTRSDAPPLKTESRLFCRTRLTERKLYRREEIDRLSNGQGLDVFRSRGGYYNNPRTGRITPWCRHIWQGVIVTRNR